MPPTITMVARTRKSKGLHFDARIAILDRNAVEASDHAKQVFKTTSAILALVREKMIDDKDSLQLSGYCFNVCEMLEMAIQGKDVGDLDESVRKGLDDLERILCEIERTLRRGASVQHTGYNKEKVEAHKLEIQEILDSLNAPGSHIDESLSVDKRAANLAPVGPRDAATTSVPDSVCGRLIRRAFALHEFPFLIEAIFSSKNEGDAIRHLLEDDAQIFVNVIDEGLDRPNLSLSTRKKCLKLLYRTCGHHALLPEALKIPICYDRTGVALYRGGFADVWKGEHCGRDVAVKVIRTYSNSDLQKIVGRFCKEVVTWKTLQHPNILPLIGVTMSESQFAMISNWMVNGNINDFVKAHPGSNLLELLGGVANGLVYIHNQGMIHGDLKGANILVDETGHARLADFGLLTIISDPANLLSSGSHIQGGTARWMSPELIAPQRFGLNKSRPTKSSDCYALGMVVYETISGGLPFHEDTDLTVITKVLEGQRPPRRAGFTRSLWGVLELCWASQPSSRPSIEEVLRGLEAVSNSSEQPSPGVDEELEEDGDDWDLESSSSGIPNGMSGVTTTDSERRTTTSSGYLTDHPLSPVPTISATGATIEADADGLGYEATDRDLLIPWIHSNDGGTCQDPPPVSGVVGGAERPSLDMQTPNYYRFSNANGLVRGPLSASDPGHLQAFDPMQESDYIFRLVALVRIRQFGVHLSGPKQDAILHGDLSNTVVHPFFVHAMAPVGMHFCDVEHSPRIIRLRTKHAQRAYEQLAEINMGNNASLLVYALFFFAATALHVGFFELARHDLKKACIALNATRLRFIPDTERPPKLTDDVREQLVMLSQVIYLENYMFLAVDEREPTMTTRIEKEFRHELQKSYPHLFKICPLIMRTQGILLVKDVVLIVMLCSAGEAKLGQRRQICHELMTRLDEYSDTLLRNMRISLQIDDRQGAEIIQGSCIGCLAHLAVLCDLIGRLEPNSKPQVDAVCDSSLERLGRLTQEMYFDEYTCFDLLLMISWKRSLVTFDSRIGRLSREEGTSLRFCRTIVAGALSDIEAKLPNLSSPSALPAQMVFHDGREEGSKYPNFMLVSERIPYGL